MWNQALKIYRFGVKKQLHWDKYCADSIAHTTSLIAKVAGITLGPAGRNVLIQGEMQEPRITKDGVTVVKHLEFEDRLQDAIATLMKNSVNSTNKFAGDGTTTSTLLIAEIVKKAQDCITRGAKVRQIREGLKIGRDIALQFIDSVCRKAETMEQLEQIALVATNGNRELSKILSECVFMSSSIKVEKSQKIDTYVEYYSGMKIPRGIPHPQFKNFGDKLVYNYPLVMVSLLPLLEIKQVVGAMELAKLARKQLLILAPEISESVLSTMIYNRRKEIVQCCGISFPAYGTKYIELLKGVAQHTGAHLFAEFGVSVQDIKFDHLGKAIKVDADDIQFWIQGKQSKENSNATIYAGGRTETEILQTYDKVVDALSSVKGAKSNGLLAGGGVTYWKIANLLDTYEGQFEQGVKVLANALRYPRRRLLEGSGIGNKGLEGDNWQGFVFRTGKVEDMFQAGIVDSVLVGKNVLIDSVSLGQLLMDIEVAVMRQEPNNRVIDYESMRRQFML